MLSWLATRRSGPNPVNHPAGGRPVNVGQPNLPERRSLEDRPGSSPGSSYMKDYLSEVEDETVKAILNIASKRPNQVQELIPTSVETIARHIVELQDTLKEALATVRQQAEQAPDNRGATSGEST
jgi:hypothetical protein